MTCEASNKALKFAVEHNNMELLTWVLASKDLPDNINECLLLAIEKNQPEMVKVFSSKVKVEPKKVTPRALKVVKNFKLDMAPNSTNVSENSQWMITLQIDSAKALAELEAGEISMEEINHQNATGWTALMYLVINANMIPGSELLIKKLLEMDANVNAKKKRKCTALQLACNNINKDSNEKIVELLWNYPKTDLQHVDEDGMSAISYLVKNCRKDQLAFVKERIIKMAPLDGKFLVTLFERNAELAEECLKEKYIKIDWTEDFQSFSNMYSHERQKLFALIKKYA